MCKLTLDELDATTLRLGGGKTILIRQLKEAVRVSVQHKISLDDVLDNDAGTSTLLVIQLLNMLAVDARANTNRELYKYAADKGADLNDAKEILDV